MSVTNINIREKFEKDVLNQVQKTLYKLDEYVLENSNEINKKYKKHILYILEKINQFQGDEKFIIGSISFVLSRVYLETGILKYPIFVYGEKIYIDVNDYMDELDVSEVFNYFVAAKKILNTEVKKYVGKFTSADINHELNKYIKIFNSYQVKILKKVFLEEEIKTKVQNLKTTDDFIIIQNEIYEEPNYLYNQI